MRDAFGGIVNIVIIVVFLVIVSGYMAYTVNYTKAFRVKNKIITTFEQYDKGCENDNTNSECNRVIRDYMAKVGYSQQTPSGAASETLNGTLSNGWKCPDKMGYCFAVFPGASTTDGAEKHYYKIKTWVNMDIPLINKIMPTLFQVQGDSKAVEIPD